MLEPVDHHGDEHRHNHHNTHHGPCTAHPISTLHIVIILAFFS